MQTIFVFAYYSFKDPVFQSAVMPYLKMMKDVDRKFILLTWEQQQFLLSKDEKKIIFDDLSTFGIVWYSTCWHSGRFKVLKKAFDFIKALVLSVYLINKHKAEKIFSEGFPGAVIGHYLSLLTKRKHIVHTFEPHADYMLESGVWQASNWEYKFLKKMEIRVAKHAQYVITATEAYKDILSAKGITNVEVIPSCIDTSVYKYQPDERKILRNDLGLSDDTIVIVYLGKIGGMYMEEELYQFMKFILNFESLNVQFYLFTDKDKRNIESELNKINVPIEKILIRQLNKNDVPRFLSAADIAFCGIRPIVSRRYSSPIKNGEYWACGLPILMPSGISDDYNHNYSLNIGYNFRNFEEITPECLERLIKIDREFIVSQGYILRGLSKFKGQFESIIWH